MCARDRRIVDRVLAGETLASVAADYGLSRQRAAQIFHAARPEVDLRERHRQERAKEGERREAARAGNRLELHAQPRVRRATGSVDDASILRALAEWAREKGRPPTVAEWSAARRSPSAQVLARRFGSWSAALERAGLEAPRASGGRGRRWSEVALIGAVAQFLARPDAPARDRGGQVAYSRWAAEVGGPSISLLRLRFGSWSAAKAAALRCLEED